VVVCRDICGWRKQRRRTGRQGPCSKPCGTKVRENLHSPPGAVGVGVSATVLSACMLMCSASAAVLQCCSAAVLAVQCCSVQLQQCSVCRVSVQRRGVWRSAAAARSSMSVPVSNALSTNHHLPPSTSNFLTNNFLLHNSVCTVPCLQRRVKRNRSCPQGTASPCRPATAGRAVSRAQLWGQ